MSYGVNRSAKRSTTRRKKRPASAGRARSAGKSKRRATKRKSVSRARSTPKRRAPKRSTARKSRKKTSAKARKPKTVTRYDPEFGTKVKVAADSWEALNWPSRKPSKKRQQRAQLLADPVGTIGTIGTTAGKRAIEKAGEQAGRSVLRAAKGAGLAAVGLTTGALGAAAASAAILAAGYVVMDKVAKTQALKLGDRLNAISTRFVQTQAQLSQAYGNRPWNDLPADVRNKALADYKRAIATASSQAQGSAIVGVRESYH